MLGPVGIGVGLWGRGGDPGAALLRSAIIYMPMMASDLYDDAGTAKIRNYGTNGHPGYIVGNGVANDITFATYTGQSKGLRAKMSVNPNAFGVRIPVAHANLDTGNYTVCIRYARRNEEDGVAYNALAFMQPRTDTNAGWGLRNAGTANLWYINAFTGNYTNRSLNALARKTVIATLATGAGGAAKVYIDGVDLGGSLTKATGTNTGADHLIGGGVSNAAGAYVAQANRNTILDVAIFDRILTSIEIANLNRYWNTDGQTHVDYLDGQSNMVGSGTDNLISAAVGYAPINGVLTYDCNRDRQWSVTRAISDSPIPPGNASGIGPEIGYAYALNGTVQRILKSGRVSTQIAAWFPNSGNPPLSETMFDLLAEGAWKLSGAVVADAIVFAQGEQDAVTLANANAYQANFTKWMYLARTLFSAKNAKVIHPTLATDINPIHGLTYLSTVNTGITNACTADGNAAAPVTATGGIGTDGIHRTGAAYIADGQLWASVR